MISLANSIKNSFKKELKNAGTKKLNDDTLVDAGLNITGKEVKKGISSIKGSGITLTNNEIKDIMKIIKSLENRGILSKGTIRKTTCQKGGFLNFLRPLITDGLQLTKNVLAPLAKSVLILLGLTAAAASTADAAIQKKKKKKKFMDQAQQNF